MLGKTKYTYFLSYLKILIKMRFCMNYYNPPVWDKNGLEIEQNWS